MQTRQIEAFGRKVTTTAGHLIGPVADPTTSSHYQHAMTEIQRELRRPRVQRKMFSYAQTAPSDLVRSRFSTSEIQYRALATLPDELLANIPEDTSSFSLFQGFQASLPEEEEHRKSHRRRNSRGQRLLDGDGADDGAPATGTSLRRERDGLNRRLDMMGVRKNMCSAEIREIDTKIANLNNMRKIVLDRLAGLEMDEAELEHEREPYPDPLLVLYAWNPLGWAFFQTDRLRIVVQLDNRLDDMEETVEDDATEPAGMPRSHDSIGTPGDAENQAMDASFMSESIYEKLPSPRTWKHKTTSLWPSLVFCSLDNR